MSSTPVPADGAVRAVGQHLLPGDTAGAITVVGLQEYRWSAVREIYAAGIATAQATFESRPPDWKTFTGTRRRIGDRRR